MKWLESLQEVLYFSILRVRVGPSLVPRLPQEPGNKEPGNKARWGQAIL